MANEEIGSVLRRLREEQGLSQEQLGFRAELHRTYVSSVERGKRNVSLETIEKFAEALGVRMAQLMP